MATSPCARWRRSRPCSRTMRRPAPNRRSRRPRKTSSRRRRNAPASRTPTDDAEVRGPADAGPGRDSPGPRRDRRGRAPAKGPPVAVAAAGQCRPWAPRRGERAADRRPRLRPAMPPLPERKPARTVAQQIAANEGVSEYAKRPAPQGLDAHGRQAPVASGATGRRPSGYSGLPAPAVQLTFVTIRTIATGPGVTAGAFVYPQLWISQARSASTCF